MTFCSVGEKRPDRDFRESGRRSARKKKVKKVKNRESKRQVYRLQSPSRYVWSSVKEMSLNIMSESKCLKCLNNVGIMSLCLNVISE